MKDTRMDQPQSRQTRLGLVSLPRKLGAIILFILFLNLFFFHSFGTLGFALAGIGCTIFLFSMLWNRESAFVVHLPFLVGSVLLGGLLVHRTSMPVVVLLGCVLLGIQFLYVYIGSRNKLFVSGLLEVLMIPLLLFRDYIFSCLPLIVSVFKGELFVRPFHHERVRTAWPLVRSVLTGGIIAVPVIAILTSMLMGADPVFSSYVTHIGDWIFKLIPQNLSQELIARLVISAVLFVGLFPLIVWKSFAFRSPLVWLRGISFAREWSIVMGLVAFVLGAFILIQWPYIFASVVHETDLARFGVATYSEYVQKGFGELLRAVVFVYLLVWAGLVLVRHANAGTARSLRVVQGVVLGEFSIFILSIFRRIWLYQAYHGWSLVRIYGGILLIWLTGITLTLALRHFSSKRWVITEIVFTLLVIVSVGLFNAEDFLVTSQPPTVNKRVDYVYLSRLSADGYRGWKMSYQYAKDVMELKMTKNAYLTADDRREIAYAGMVTHALTEQYVSLLRYATPDEQRHFYRQFLQARIEVLGELREPFLKKDDYASPPMSDLDIQRKLTADQFAKIDLSEDSYKQMHFYISSWPYGFSFYMNRGDMLSAFGTLNDPTIMTPWGKAETKRGPLDDLFEWNGREAQTYKQMQIDIPFVEIFTMQNNFLLLAERIANQPKNEQSLDIDISTESPFLSVL
jgi:hypothetical protein